jgi:L,D-transpeptidase catalytic domain
MVEAAPSPSFKMSQPDLLLEFLIVAFDPPSQLGNVDELTERDVFRKRRQPIFDRLLLAIGPFNQQPLRPTVGEPVIPMRDTNAHTGKSRGQLLPRGFPPLNASLTLRGSWPTGRVIRSARALYLGQTIFRIHGTNQPSTIGTFVSSGCIRLTNEDITDLHSRVKVGTRVVVLPGREPATTGATSVGSRGTVSPGQAINFRSAD